MQDISGFLKKFSHILQHKENVLHICLDVLGEYGISTSREGLKLKNKKLYTKIYGGDKGYLFIKKKQIIKEINSRVGKNVVIEIQ